VAKGVWRRLTPEVRREVLRLSANGVTNVEIARAVSRSASSINAVVRSAGGVIRRDVLLGCHGRLSLEDRIDIDAGIRAGESFVVIAARIGVHPSTVSREVQRHHGKRRYRPVAAHLAAERSRCRPKLSKLDDARLGGRVSAMLEELASPEQIAGRLRIEFPDEPEMWVSHETIYKSLYVQGRGQLRRELAACLRSGRAQRQPRGRLEKRGSNAGMVMISERPAEVDDRAIPGHWEGDLIIGKNGGSAIGTLVERSTRLVLLLHLPGRHDAVSVRDEMIRVMQALPIVLQRSVTWDQGREMARHAEFTAQTGIDVYFCDPHSPWQRGSNENTNGLLRQYFPKGTDLSVHDRAELERVQASMNNRPRKTLGYMTPSESFTKVIAPTD
jgi:transposase, IS30 family